MSAAIEIREVSKRYGANTVVDALSLTVEPGEIYAFLGLNGAGKTTTIRMMLGMVKPTAGNIAILGTPIAASTTEVWASVGHLVETAAAYPELTVRENLEVVRRLHRLPDRDAVARIIDRLGLGAEADRRADTLSLGNAQRLGLAKALIHRPPVLLLDEPVNGLDPAGVVEVRHLLRDLADEEGTTVFMSSHQLGEVARLADRIGIIHEARLIKEITISDLQRRSARRLVVGTRDPARAAAVIAELGYRHSTSDDGTFSIHDERAVSRPEDVASALALAGAPPNRLLIEEDDLETYFLELVGAPIEPSLR